MPRIIAFDLGRKSLGIAICDALMIAAHGYENYRFNEGAFRNATNHALEVIKKEEVNEVCIGLALNMDGSESQSSKSARHFKDDLLKAMPDLKVELVDERLTTVIATNRLLEADLSRNKRKKVIDMMSAVVILESYLSTRGKK